MDPFELLETFYEHRCEICCGNNRHPASCYLLPVAPASFQSMAQTAGLTATYRQAVLKHIADNGYQRPVSWKSRQPINAAPAMSTVTSPRDVCVGLLFVFDPSANGQDLDNSAKAILDAIKGKDGLIADDMEIVHLECFKRANLSGKSIPIPTGQVTPLSVPMSSFVAVRIGLAK